VIFWFSKFAFHKCVLYRYSVVYIALTAAEIAARRNQLAETSFNGHERFGDENENSNAGAELAALPWMGLGSDTLVGLGHFHSLTLFVCVCLCVCVCVVLLLVHKSSATRCSMETDELVLLNKHLERYFAVKTAIDDSRYSPCNRSDTQECPPTLHAGAGASRGGGAVVQGRAAAQPAGDPRQQGAAWRRQRRSGCAAAGDSRHDPVLGELHGRAAVAGIGGGRGVVF
jgi:hypothetical protein